MASPHLLSKRKKRSIYISLRSCRPPVTDSATWKTECLTALPGKNKPGSFYRSLHLGINERGFKKASHNGARAS